jgi:hypothetical protein
MTAKQQSNSHQQQESASKTKICRFMIIVWTETAKDEQCIHKEKPVSELDDESEYCYSHYYFTFCICT